MISFDTLHELKKFLEENDSQALFIEGFDEAILGLADTFYGLVLVYDQDKIIKILSRAMPVQEAEDHFAFGILGSYIGELQPIYLAGLLDTRKVK